MAHQGGGGRMFVGDNSIYFTTGEFRNRPLAQMEDNVYGKIQILNLNQKNQRLSLWSTETQGLYYSQK